MRYCKTCDVKYEAPLDNCIICSDALEKSENEVIHYDFAPYQKKSNKSEIFFKGLFLLNLMAIIISLTLEFIIDKTFDWSLIVSVSNLYLILFVRTLKSHSKFAIRLFWIVILSILELLAIGFLTDDFYWALDIVMPLSLILNTILLIVFTLSKRKRWQDYAMFLIISSLSNMTIILLPIFEVAQTNWAYIASFLFGLFTLISLFIFSPKDLKEEFLRRFHT